MRWYHVAGLEQDYSYPRKGKPTLLEENSLPPHQPFLFLYMAVTYSFNLLFLIYVYMKLFHIDTCLCVLPHFCFTDNKIVVMHSVTHLYIFLYLSLLLYAVLNYDNTFRAFSVTDIIPHMAFNIDT